VVVNSKGYENFLLKILAVIFSLTKTVNTYSIFDGRDITEKSSLYSIRDGDSTLAQLFYSRWECLCSFKDEKFYMNEHRKLFQKQVVDIRHVQTEKLVGEYRLTNWTILIGSHYEIRIHDRIFTAKRRSPKVRYSLFKRQTWGYYEIELKSRNETIAYRFKLDLGVVAVGNPSTEIPFEGEVETQSASDVAMILGCYLIEKILESATD